MAARWGFVIALVASACANPPADEGRDADAQETRAEDGDGGAETPGEADGGEADDAAGCDPAACDAECVAGGALAGVCREDACECVGGGDGDADAGGDGEAEAGGEADDAVGEDAEPDDGGADPFWTDDDGDTYAEATGDCDDTDDRIHPGATEHLEGIDYDCDTRREFRATIILTVDDEYDLCVNGVVIATAVPEHMTAETYEIVLDAGRNVIGVHGYDTIGITAAMSMWVGVAGLEIKSDGVLADEPDTTSWRYYPSEDEDPQATWCDVGFDDGDWGPALFNAEQDDGEWLANPPELRGRDVDWVWDGRPRDLRQAWFRRVIDVPAGEPPRAAPGVDVCTPAGSPITLVMTSTDRLHNGVALAWTGTQFAAVWDEWYAPWRAGCDELFVQYVDAGGAAVGTPTRLTTGTWWNTFPDAAWGADTLAIANEDGQNNRNFDQLYLVRADAAGAEIGDDVRLTTTSGWSKRPSIAFDGTDFGVAFQDDRDGTNGAFEIWFLRVSPAGAVVGSPVRLTDADGSSRIPSLAWSGTEWGVAWEDVRDGNFEIYFTRVSAAGAEVGGDVRVTDDPAVSSAPVLAWSGTEWGLAWDEERDGNREIYFATIGADGTVGTPVRVTADGAISSDADLVWNGSGWTIVWRDARDGNDEIYAVRLDADGARIGDDSRLTTSDGRSWHPKLVWTGTQYGLLWEEATDPAAAPYDFRARFVRFTCP